MAEVKTIKATPRTLKRKIQEIKDRGERILDIVVSKSQSTYPPTTPHTANTIVTEFIVVSQ